MQHPGQAVLNPIESASAQNGAVNSGARLSALIREIGVALLVAFVAGAIFLLGQLMYAQLVLMPRVVASGSGVLAVDVHIKWAAGAAAAAFAVYLIWRLRPGTDRR
jgi:hypothetical protein